MREIKVDRFSLKDTLECGQTFCWRREDNGYVCTDVGQVVYVEQNGDRLLYETSHGNIDLKKLFRIDDPIDTIWKEIDKDDLMHKSILFAPGLRIVSDPFFPCLISFLCSVRNNIPAIYRATQRIRERWGPTYRFRDKTYYGMPDPGILAEVNPAELKEMGLGWRAEFITRSAKAIALGEIDEHSLRRTTYEEAHTDLKRLYGVGDKVADCVSLFSLGHLEAFPIDVWIERVIQRQYGIFTKTGKSYAKKSRAAREYFGKYAGYAQEYLYYYSRSTF